MHHVHIMYLPIKPRKRDRRLGGGGGGLGCLEKPEPNNFLPNRTMAGAGKTHAIVLHRPNRLTKWCAAGFFCKRQAKTSKRQTKDKKTSRATRRRNKEKSPPFLQTNPLISRTHARTNETKRFPGWAQTPQPPIFKFFSCT